MSANKYKTPGTYVHGCMVSNCNNRYYFPITDTTYKNKTFFKFPSKDLERRHKWFNIINLEFTEKRSYLCEDHFHEKQFSDTFKKRLLKYAIPSATLCFRDTIEKNNKNASVEEPSGIESECSSKSTEENYFPVSKKLKVFPLFDSNKNESTKISKINLVSNLQIRPPNLFTTKNYADINPNLHPPPSLDEAKELLQPACYFPESAAPQKKKSFSISC